MSYNISTLIECPNLQIDLGAITDKGLNPGASEKAPEHLGDCLPRMAEIDRATVSLTGPKW